MQKLDAVDAASLRDDIPPFRAGARLGGPEGRPDARDGARRGRAGGGHRRTRRKRATGAGPRGVL